MIRKDIKVLIVEDEDIYLQEMLEILNSCGVTQITSTDNYKSAVKILDDKKFDIALIDIFIKGDQTGISLGRYIREKFEFPFIYVSSNLDSNVLKIARETHPDAFISKPIDKHTLICNVELVVHNWMADFDNVAILDDRIFIKKDGVYEKLFLKDITIVESDHVYNFLYMKDGGRIMVRGRLKDFYEKFPNYFIQINRACAINMYFIDHFDKQTITVNNKVLEVGRKYKSQVFPRLMTF
ncbi:MAG: LytR/AlgR family response regulator transcription factor [Labilibaculum antarcticum]